MARMRLFPAITMAMATWHVPANAKEQKPPAIRAVPAGNAGDWIRSEDYPVAAMVDGVQGMSALLIDVDVDGRVTNCTISASSGSDALDETACNLVRQRARFTPAKDKKSKPVPDRVPQRIYWRLPNPNPPQVGSHHKFKVTYDVDEEGKVVNCTVLVAENSDAKQNAYCDHMMKSKRQFFVVDKDGNPVEARMTYSTEGEITPR